MIKPLNNPAFNQISDHLVMQTKLVESFIQHLEAIKESVTSNNLEQLNNLITQTPDFFKNLETIQSQLVATLSVNGFNDIQNGLQSFIQRHDDVSQHLFNLKTTLNKNIEVLEKTLLVNDLLIRKNQQRIKQSIRILSGHETSQSPGTYSSKGNTSQNTDGQHTLARA